MRSLRVIQTQERQYLHKRRKSGPGYRKRYTKLISKALRGITHHLTMHSSCGTAGKSRERACIGLQRYATL